MTEKKFSLASIRERCAALTSSLRSSPGFEGGASCTPLRYLIVLISGLLFALCLCTAAENLIMPSTVVPDLPTNSLVFTASQEQFNSLKEILQQLDTQPKQVLLRGLIAEVNLNKLNSAGIDWAAWGGDIFGSTVMRSGLSLTEVLKLLQRQTRDKSLKPVFTELRESVEDGRSLASSMQQLGVFRPSLTGMPLQNWKAALNQMYLIYGGRFEL